MEWPALFDSFSQEKGIKAFLQFLKKEGRPVRYTILKYKIMERGMYMKCFSHKEQEMVPVCRHSEKSGMQARAEVLVCSGNI